MKEKFFFIIYILLIVSCGVDSDLYQNFPDIAIKLVFPENNSECNTGIFVSELESDVTFEWKEFDINNGYKIHVTNLLEESTTIYESSEAKLPIRLFRGNPYSWFVTDKDNLYKSETWSFYNAGDGEEAFIPFPANIISPILGTTFSATTSSVVLDWEGNDLDNDIQSYDVYFGSSSPPLYYDSITDHTISVPVTTSNTYYWYVITRDSIGNESISDTSTFSVE